MHGRAIPSARESSPEAHESVAHGWAHWYPTDTRGEFGSDSRPRREEDDGKDGALGRASVYGRGRGRPKGGAVDCLASQVVYRAKESLANAEPPLTLPYVIALCSHCCTLHQRWWHSGTAHSMAVGTHGST